MQEAAGLPLDLFLKDQEQPESFNIKYWLSNDLQKSDPDRIARIVKISDSAIYVSMFLNTVPKEKSK